MSRSRTTAIRLAAMAIESRLIRFRNKFFV